MKSKRRDFLKYSGLAGLGMAGGVMKVLAANKTMEHLPEETSARAGQEDFADDQLTMIGLYGPWAASLTANKLPSLSFRNPGWTDIESWRSKARQQVMDRMARRISVHFREVRVIREFVYDALLVKELEWQLPYGRATEATLLKPVNARGLFRAFWLFMTMEEINILGKEKLPERKINRTL